MTRANTASRISTAVRTLTTSTPPGAESCVGPETRLKESWVLEVRIGPCAGGKPLKIKMLMQSRAVTRGKRPYDNWMVAGIAPDVGQ